MSERLDFSKVNDLDERIRLEYKYIELRDAVVAAAKINHDTPLSTGPTGDCYTAYQQLSAAVIALIQFERENNL